MAASTSIDDNTETPKPSTSSQSLPFQQQQQLQQLHHPHLTSQHSNISDNYLLEELLVKIQYFNNRALNYYILTENLFNSSDYSIAAVDDGPIIADDEKIQEKLLNENNSSDNDSGLDSSFTSTGFFFS